MFGCFWNRGERDKDNETGLKEGGGIKMSTTVLPLRDARSLRFEYLPSTSGCSTVTNTDDTFFAISAILNSGYVWLYELSVGMKSRHSFGDFFGIGKDLKLNE